MNKSVSKCVKSRRFLRAVATIVVSAVSLGGVFATAGLMHGLMNDGVCGGVCEMVSGGLIGCAVGLIVGAGIAMVGSSSGSLSMACLGRIMVAGLLVALVCGAIGAAVSYTIGDGRFALIPPLVLAMAGMIVGMCAAAIYVADEDEDNATAAPGAKPVVNVVVRNGKSDVQRRFNSRVRRIAGDHSRR